jgi:hypothetical protein
MVIWASAICTRLKMCVVVVRWQVDLELVTSALQLAVLEGEEGFRIDHAVGIYVYIFK